MDRYTRADNKCKALLDFQQSFGTNKHIESLIEFYEEEIRIVHSELVVYDSQTAGVEESFNDSNADGNADFNIYVDNYTNPSGVKEHEYTISNTELPQEIISMVDKANQKIKKHNLPPGNLLFQKTDKGIISELKCILMVKQNLYTRCF